MALSIGMMVGMFAGAVSSTINDSFGNVEDTCAALKNSKDQLDKLDKNWTNIIKNMDKIEQNIDSFNNGIQNSAIMTASATIMLKKTFEKKKQSQLIGLSVFTFVLIMTLLFKYFNIFGNIWNLITK